MALPQRQDPDPNRPLRDIADGSVARAVGGGWQFNAWWVWLLILFVVCGFIWFAGFGWGGYGGWWWAGRTHTAAVQTGNGNAANPQVTTSTETGAVNMNGPAGQQANSSEGAPVETNAILSANDRHAFIGKPLRLENVQVEAKDGHGAFWVGGNGATPILVVLAGAEANVADTNISDGNRMDVTGTVEKSPSEAKAKRQWDLGSHDARQLEQQGVYVEATRAQLAR